VSQLGGGGGPNYQINLTITQSSIDEDSSVPLRVLFARDDKRAGGDRQLEFIPPQQLTLETLNHPYEDH
jgi:hypothetical protein